MADSPERRCERRLVPAPSGRGSANGPPRAAWSVALLVASVFVAIAGAAARSGEPPLEVHVHESMATRFELRLPAAGGSAEAAAAVWSIIDDVDARMSEWKETSPLSAVNREAGLAPVEVPDDPRAVVRRGVQIGAATDGAFDVTWAALWGLWDFRAARPSVPDAAAIERRAALVDYRDAVVDDAAGTVFLKRVGMKLGLGGIAKGWALDRAAAELRRRDVPRFLLSAGGQVMTRGTFRVGIRDPRGAPDDFFAIVEVTDASVSTSGDYERYFLADGVRYHHILDPRTGRPARGVRGVTTLSRDATLADAMSTAILVLGVERGLALAESTEDLEAVLVDATGAVYTTAALADRLTLVHPPIAAD